MTETKHQVAPQAMSLRRARLCDLQPADSVLAFATARRPGVTCDSCRARMRELGYFRINFDEDENNIL